jgi:RimJ/RimL family protein N-acetyltransferase
MRSLDRFRTIRARLTYSNEWPRPAHAGPGARERKVVRKEAVETFVRIGFAARRKRHVEQLLEKCAVRSWLDEDAGSLAEHANNKAVWRNLRDAFPHPYRFEDAVAFIAASRKDKPETRFAIAVDGLAVGGVGFTLHSDVERVSAEIGYWLGEKFWGRGIVTEALKATTEYAIRTQHLTRVYAVPYESNPASHRVLEKAGYLLEGRMRRNAIKDGRVLDQMLYAYVVP